VRATLAHSNRSALSMNTHPSCWRSCMHHTTYDTRVLRYVLQLSLTGERCSGTSDAHIQADTTEAKETQKYEPPPSMELRDTTQELRDATQSGAGPETFSGRGNSVESERQLHDLAHSMVLNSSGRPIHVCNRMTVARSGTCEGLKLKRHAGLRFPPRDSYTI
jgi:hypothetical protein